MAGSDDSHNRNVIGFQSRLVAFPDGLTRHITLTNWEWEVFDRAHGEAGYDYLPEGAYLHALQCWLEESFNENARPARGLTDRLRINADDVTCDSDRPSGRGRFEARLRRSLTRMIAVNMPAASGCNDPANDEFPG